MNIGIPDLEIVRAGDALGHGPLARVGQLGQSRAPTPPTAACVGMRAVLEELYGKRRLQRQARPDPGRRRGRRPARRAARRSAARRSIICDINEERVDELQRAARLRGRARRRPPRRRRATSTRRARAARRSTTRRSRSSRCKAVAGCANNQLLEPRHARRPEGARHPVRARLRDQRRRHHQRRRRARARRLRRGDVAGEDRPHLRQPQARVRDRARATPTIDAATRPRVAGRAAPGRRPGSSGRSRAPRARLGARSAEPALATPCAGSRPGRFSSSAQPVVRAPSGSGRRSARARSGVFGLRSFGGG